MLRTLLFGGLAGIIFSGALLAVFWRGRPLRWLGRIAIALSGLLSALFFILSGPSTFRAIL